MAGFTCDLTGLFEKLFLGRARGSAFLQTLLTFSCSYKLTLILLLSLAGQRIFSFTSQSGVRHAAILFIICLPDFERMQFKKYRGPPWQCSGSGCSLPPQGTQVRSLDRELDPIPRGVAKKNKTNPNNRITCFLRDCSHITIQFSSIQSRGFL